MPRVKTKNDSSPDEVKLDDEFITSLEAAKAKIERAFLSLMDERRRDEYRAAHAFPGEGDMAQILRYDRALQKKFDWALQRLLESQARRKRAQPPADILRFK